MDRKELDAIRTKTTELFKITPDNLYTKSIEMINAFPRYYDKYIMEYKAYRDLISDKDKLYGELYNKYRFNSNKELKTKSEVEPFVLSDESYYQLCLRVNEYELGVKYLEGVCDAIKRLSYNVKNIIDLKNLGMQQ